MKILFTADNHLADASWVGRPILGDAYFAAEQVADIAIARKVKVVGVAGDFLDKRRNNSRAVAVMRQMAARLKKADIDVLFVQGQHDQSDPPWLSLCPGARHLDRGFLGPVYGLDYLPGEQLGAAVADARPSCPILMCHQMWAEHAPHGAEPDGSIEELIPKHIKVVVSGDIHAHLIKEIRTKAGHKVKFISPGSTCMQDIAESDQKKVVILDTDDYSHEVVALKCRPCVKARSVASAHDLDKLLRELPSLVADAEEETKGWPEEIQRPLLRVKYVRSMPEVEDVVRELLGTRVHYFFDYVQEDGADDASAYTGAAWKGRAREILLQCLDEEFEGQTDTEAYRLARELLDNDAEHAREVVNRWYQKLCTSTTPPSSTSGPTDASPSGPPTTPSPEARSGSSAPTAPASRRSSRASTRA